MISSKLKVAKLLLDSFVHLRMLDTGRQPTNQPAKEHTHTHTNENGKRKEKKKQTPVHMFNACIPYEKMHPLGTPVTLAMSQGLRKW